MFKLAVIPARAGSKRIPGKNIRLFGGRPMIAWSIDTAFQSGLFDAVIVSTDSEEIASLALSLGAAVPFLRPETLANDVAGTRAVIAHAIQAYTDFHQQPDLVCCLYATAPFVLPADLQQGHEKLVSSGADFAYSLARFPSAIQRAVRICENGRVDMIMPENRAKRTQELEPAFYDAGQFYWGRSASFLDLEKKITSPLSVPVVLPPHRVQDIDTEEDWVRAEWMFKAMMMKSGAEQAS